MEARQVRVLVMCQVGLCQEGASELLGKPEGEEEGDGEEVEG